MSLIGDWKYRELGSFGGAWLNRDRSMIDVTGAIQAQNVEYMTGSVGTRHGFQEITVLPQFSNIIELYQWLGPFSEINPAYADNALVVAWLGGAITAIAIVGAGAGYTVAPTVTLSGAGSGSGASFTVILTSGAVTSVIVNSGGSGYPSGVTAAFTGGTYTTAATAGAVTATSGAGAQLAIYDLNTSVSGGLLGTFVPPGGGSMTQGGCTLFAIGMNLMVALFDGKQHAFAPVGVVRLAEDPATPGNPIVRRAGLGAAFPGPSTYAPGITFAGGGFIGSGAHRYGYLIEYSTGFTTRASPDSGATTIPTVATFAPVTATYSGGAGGLATMAFGANWAASGLVPGIVAISAIMTTATNLSQFYVVPGSRTLNDGAAAVNITVNISDGDLSSTGTDATTYLYWMTQSANNANGVNPVPFECRHLALWADRMVYLATVPDNQGNLIDALYASDRNNYQAITADQHVLQLPGQRTIVTMFRMVSVNYILGPHEIWGVSDNGDVPVTWSAPGLVDGRHGTQAIHGAEVAPSGDRAWIADQAGLFLFTGGAILDLPLSYYQSPDWNRINWGAAYCVRIKDDSGSRRVCVSVPLDGATEVTHVMTWDYTDGLTPETVRYSLNYIEITLGALASQPIGGMELMRNDLLNQGENLGRVELWVGLWTPNSDLSGAGILRHMSDSDTNPFRDLVYPINCKWSGPPLPGRGYSGAGYVGYTSGLNIIQHHHGFHARLRGLGTVKPIVWDVDQKNSFVCRPVTLGEAPDRDELVLADIINELAYVSFESNVIDTYFRLAFLRWYYSPYSLQR